MKPIGKKICVGLFLISITMIPCLVFAATINQHFADFNLGGQQEQNFSFRENSPMEYHSFNFTVSTLIHDAGGSSCYFCKVKVTAKRQGFLNMFYESASSTIATPTTGYYEGNNFGYIEAGNFKYFIKNDGALQNNGTIRVNVSN